ncbi:MAG TPA: ferritin-like domain-containing protein [Thermomicrobiaceae bacterium]|nr:ferritin-like domain-containing protein [Thermomicrobiaceae bacterium]
MSRSLFHSTMTRKSFLRRAAGAGAGLAAVEQLGLLAGGKALAAPQGAGLANPHSPNGKILIAAEIAEALAVTTYSNIIDNAPFFQRLAEDDQGYLRAARQEEMSHYLLEQSVTGLPSPFTTFYYPPQMFSDAQTTLNVLVTLEDAFIAAYLVGVRDFTSDDLRVTAARIMGIESDHRTLARVVAPGVDPLDGGPIETLSGIQGVAEDVDPPNNNGYERTLGWTDISQAVAALTPFVDQGAAASAGFDTSVSYDFVPFTPTLPTDLGAFHGFSG